MSGWAKTGIVLVVLVVIVLILRVTVLKPQPVKVQVVEAQNGLVENTITNSKAGTVKAFRRAKISPEISGTITAIFFREGDHVEKGAVLVQIDDSQYRASLELAQADLAVAEAQQREACMAADQAKREFERNRKLLRDGVASQEKVDLLEDAYQRAQAACTSGQAAVERARAAVTSAEVNLSKTKVLAPFSGIIAARNAEIGEIAMPTSPALPVPPILDLLDAESLYVSAPMDEVDVAKIQVGQPIRITLDSHKDRSFTGKVRRVAPFVLDVEEQNRTVEVEGNFDQPPENLYPGVSADIEIILEQTEALRVPTYALIEGDSVFVVENGVLEKRAIQTGMRNWEFVQVLSGLAAGEWIAVNVDRNSLKAGTQVETEPWQP
ncbi:MAG: efflux RND transporter periplasmic adaptor subunit [Acidobacteria bacterium]|nr:efflux RND transporter periplasmic adaptor subunit [Acidobacteriota bacterium]MCB9396588.1 efflux RND transporter periplasmic adaptor subunit [Acidobacteriota bacterium]